MISKTEAFASVELGSLMSRVEELLEARVLCMVLVHPSDALSVVCPDKRFDDTLEVLRSVEWAHV